MATRRGSTPWQGTGKSWPSGTVAGDVAVFVTTWHNSAFFAPSSRLRKWRTVGMFQNYWGGEAAWAWASWVVYAWAKTLTADDIADPPPSDYGQITVIGGTGGVGTVRKGVGMVTAKPYGGALSISVAEQSNGSDLPGGTSWQLPPGYASWQFFSGVGRHYVAVGWEGTTTGGLVGDGRTYRSMAIELLPPEQPLPPSLLSPGDGDEITSTGVVDFAWQHRPAIQGGYQDAYRLRVNNGSGWKWWNTSTASWSTSETSNASGQQHQEIAAGEFAPMVGHTWQVSTREGADGQWSLYSPARSFLPVTPPSLSLTGPSTVHNNLRPSVTWTSTTPRGVQTAYQVQIVHSTTTALLHDSRVLPGADQSYALPFLRWERGGTYLRRVRIQQTGGSWSPWVEEPLTMTWDLPSEPTVTAARAERGVEVEVSVDDEMTVVVERIGPDGLWRTIVGAAELTPGSPLTLTDVFAPYGVPTRYRVRGRIDLSGQWLESEWAQSDLVTSLDRSAYIALAAEPTTSWMPVTFTTTPAAEHVEEIATTYGLGDDYGRVTYGPEQGEQGSVTIWVMGREEEDQLTDLLLRQRLLVVRRSPEVRSDGSGQWTPGDIATWARSGRLQKEGVLPHRPGQAQIQARRISFGWIEQPPDLVEGVLDG